MKKALLSLLARSFALLAQPFRNPLRPFTSRGNEEMKASRNPAALLASVWAAGMLSMGSASAATIVAYSASTAVTAGVGKEIARDELIQDVDPADIVAVQFFSNNKFTVGYNSGKTGGWVDSPDWARAFAFEDIDFENFGVKVVFANGNDGNGSICWNIFADDGEGDSGVRWLYEENGDGTVTVTGAEPAAGNLTMPEELEGMRVTAVGTKAFKFCTGLTGMAVAPGVTNIGEEAFFHCDGLTNVTFGTNVTSIGIRAFWACRALPAVEIPAGVTNIGSSAFSECLSLGSAVLPEGVTSVEENLFEWCSSLTNATLGAGVTNIGGYAFWGCTSLAAVTLPEGVASIGKSAFEKSGLQAVRIPNATADIGEKAFSGCSYLSDVQFGTGVVNIGKWAFFSCPLTDVRLPNATTTIGEEAFDRCSYLTNIWLGTGIRSIGQDGLSARDLETLWVPVTRQGTELLDNADVPAGCEIRYYGVQAVTFDGAGGTPTAGSLDYAIGETYEALPGATRALWTFTGWQAAGGAAVTETNIVTDAETRTLYAGWEEGVTTNGVRWLCRENGEGTVEVTGAVPAAGDLEMPETLDGYTVTAVKDNAFRGCTNLTGMAISGRVTNIGWSTFEGCTSLASVAIPGSVKEIGGAAFKSCASLTNAILGAGVANIGPYAFEYCGSLASVAFPEGLAEIQTGAFMNAGLTDARLPDTTERIGGDAFYGCESLTNAWIGTGIGSVGQSAFAACWNLAAVWVPVEKAGAGLLDPDWLADGCEIHYYGTQVVTFDPNGGTCATATNDYTIGEPYGSLPAPAWQLHTFDGWQATNGTGWVDVTTNDIVTEEAARTLVAQWTNGVVVGNVLWTCQTNFDGSSVTVTRADPAEGDLVMPDTLDGFPVTAVWPYAFANCTNLTGMAIADGVTFIGEAAFENCTALTDLVIPDSVTEIGSHVFDGCSGLTNLVIGAGVTFIDSGAFYKCSGLTDVTIPDGVTHIGPSAFYGCSGLTNVTIGAGVTMIESCAFKGCSGLTEVVIPDGVREIDDLTFQDCSGLANVIIGAGVTNIGHGAFWGCTALTDVTIPDAVATIKEIAFRDCGSLTNVWLGTGVESIGKDLFTGCTNLATIWLPIERKGSDLLANAGVPDGCTIRYYGTQVVTFDANGGSCAVRTNAYAFGPGRTYGDLPEATRADRDFLGWFDAAGGGTQVTAATTVPEATARTLYAHWRERAVKYQVAFAANGGKGKMAKQTMTVGKAARLRKNAFQRKGLVFAGWGKTAKGNVAYRDQQAVKNLRTTAGTVTLHAKWAKPKYKVAFDANGGRLPKGSCMDPQTMKYGKAARLRPCRFVRSGYFFIGWAKTKDGPVAFTNQQAVKNLRRDGKTTRLYAKWARKVFYVAYDANGGKGKMANQKFIWNVADKLHANAFTREGYAFDGWAKTKTGAVAYSDRAMGNHLTVKGGTITLYAKWKKVAVKKAATAASTAPKAAAAASKAVAPPAAPVFSVDDCGVFAAGGCELAILPDPPTVEELADREEAEELENPIAVAFRVPEGGAAWQFWSAERGLLAEDAVSAATVELALPDLGLWHWLRFLDADGGTLSSTWIFAADE